jgi:hypothetical protein
VDFFDFFRIALGVFVTIYYSIVTWQSLYGWYVFLNGQDKYVTLVRRYVIVQGLRLRFRTFWGDVLVCILLCVLFLIIFRAHWVLTGVERTLRDAQRNQQIHWR